MLKTIFVNTLKILVAAGLIYWLVTSGKLDFNLLAKLKDYPLSVITAAALCILNCVLISYRWKLILKSRSNISLPLFGLVKINWIGQFFSSVLPGSVSGDLIKIFYVQKYSENFSKKFIFASIFIDRLMGLAGLILLVGMTSIIFESHILKNAPAMENILYVNYSVVLVVIAAMLIFFFFNHHVKALLEYFQKIALASVFGKIITLWDDLVSIKSKIIKAVAVSVLVQLTAVVIFWSLIYPYVEGHMDFIQALAFIPLGLMALALPIAPSGLGVGHAIFQKLFEFSGIDNGASLFNLYFVVTLIMNALGFIPYLLTKIKKEN